MIVYHMTKDENIESIKKDGFKSEFRDRIYFAKCEFDIASVAMFHCRVYGGKWSVMVLELDDSVKLIRDCDGRLKDSVCTLKRTIPTNKFKILGTIEYFPKLFPNNYEHADIVGLVGTMSETLKRFTDIIRSNGNV